MRKNILVFADYFLPAERAGGPILTIFNLIRILGEEYDFFVVTRDRDLGDDRSFEGIVLDEWTNHRGVRVRYLTPSWQSVRTILQILSERRWDLIYLNSFYSRRFSMLVSLCNALRRVRMPVLIAPKGEFSMGFLSQKPYRKRLFLSLVRWLGLYDRACWQASTQLEKRDILRQLPGASGRVFVAEDMASLADDVKIPVRQPKRTGELRVCFVSRIHRMKNLHWALEVLKNVDFEMEFNIYGGIHDPSYWGGMQRELEAMTPNVSVTYHGDVSHGRVYEVFSEHHLMFLPTLGENFGHAIIEALLCGCPVLISDATVWSSVSREGCGWALPLGDRVRFLNALRAVHAMDADEFAVMSGRAKEFGRRVLENDDVVQAHRRMLDAAMGAIPWA